MMQLSTGKLAQMRETGASQDKTGACAWVAPATSAGLLSCCDWVLKPDFPGQSFSMLAMRCFVALRSRKKKES